MTLSYAVIGTGAIGGYYGGRLAEAGCDVHFLLRSDYAHVKAHGLSVKSVEGDFSLPNVQAYDNPVDMPPVDVVLVCLKTTQNKHLPELLPPIKEGGAILPLQNGFDIESSIEQILKERLEDVPTIFGGLCFICASKVGAGRIEHIDYGRLLLGEYMPAVSSQFAPVDLLKAIAVDFNRAKIATDITNDLPMARWLKLVWNVPYNGLSVVLNATTAEMMADSHVRELILALMREVVAIANAWGAQNDSLAEKAAKEKDDEETGFAEIDLESNVVERSLSDDIVEQMFEQTETMPAYATSMKLDFDRKSPLETDAIFRAPLEVAKALDVAAPAMTMLYQQLMFLDAQNRR